MALDGQISAVHNKSWQASRFILLSPLFGLTLDVEGVVGPLYRYRQVDDDDVIPNFQLLQARTSCSFRDVEALTADHDRSFIMINLVDYSPKLIGYCWA
jgi:hypothetical protein